MRISPIASTSKNNAQPVDFNQNRGLRRVATTRSKDQHAQERQVTPTKMSPRKGKKAVSPLVQAEEMEQFRPKTSVSSDSRKRHGSLRKRAETEEHVRLISREEFGKRLDDTIKRGDFEEISDLITPYQLTKCEMNCLEKSLEVSYKLRNRALGPDAEDLEQMGTAVEEFAFHLLDPLKNDDDMRSKLKGQNFDRVIDKAVAFKQMKFLSHPVLYNLLKKRWKGSRLYKIRSRSPFIWCLLNFWTVFDVLLFVLIFPLLYLIHIITTKWCTTETKFDPFEYYLEYFTAPYFIFARDTISYLVLLALHYAMCLHPIKEKPRNFEHYDPSKHHSRDYDPSHDYIEGWIIIFFLGRLMMEINQVVSGVIEEKRKSWDSESGGIKIRQTKWWKFNTMISRYAGDWWNLLDAISIVTFIVIIILRIWLQKNVDTDKEILSEDELKTEKSNSAAAEYLYGINTILLTIRVFGHIMESRKFTGSIQIALFHIIGAVIAISGQFLAVLLAFSFAITKTYLAGESFIKNATFFEAKPKNSTFTKSTELWLNSFLDLTWSLLGEVKEESVTSPHSTSKVFAKVLYALFLVMGGVMLLNMLIALLTNTYQKVENNAFYEWSHKKAITIRTYCTYHPVPVPFNIVSLLFKFIRHIYRTLPNCNKYQEDRPENIDNSQEFKDLILYLQSEYFSVYGYAFPKTDGEKLNDLVKETKGCRQLMGNIAGRVFEYSFEEKQQIAHKYETDRWYSYGIKIDGQQITYVDCECYGCKNYGPTEYNGGFLYQPLPADWPKFEVLIQECTELRFIVIGLVDNDWDPHDIPGSKGNSVGYRVHEGKVFDRQNPKTGRYVIDSSAFRGDVIGCELMFEERSSGGIPVYFTLNGKFIGDAWLKTEDEDGISFKFCPFVGIGSEGITLLFRMRSREPVPCGLDSTNQLVLQNSKAVESLKTMRSKEMDLLTNLTDLFDDTKKSIDGMFTRVMDLQQQVNFLKNEVEFWKDQGSGSHIVDLHKEIDFLRNEIKFWKDQVLTSKEAPNKRT